MILGTVKGTVYSTRKMENLKGLKKVYTGILSIFYNYS